MRVEPHQGKFCEKIGVSRNRQSFLENGERELRAEYLDLISEHGLDVGYILTGRRDGARLGVRESAMLDVFQCLDVQSQDAFLLLARRIVGDTHNPALGAALHDQGMEYRGE